MTEIRDFALHCEAKKHAYRQTQDGVVVSFVLHPQDIPDGLALAPLGTRYMLALVEVSDDEQPKESAKKPRPQSADNTLTAGGAHHNKSWHEMAPAQQAGLLCNEPSFGTFLREKVDQSGIVGPDRAAEIVRDLCEVKSRSELSTNNEASMKWRGIVSDYRAWMREPAVVE
jgi:hypothetical protein